jgi:hypothetical protein
MNEQPDHTDSSWSETMAARIEKRSLDILSAKQE